jgi:hypothetical protein
VPLPESRRLGAYAPSLNLQHAMRSQVQLDVGKLQYWDIDSSCLASLVANAAYPLYRPELLLEYLQIIVASRVSLTSSENLG